MRWFVPLFLGVASLCYAPTADACSCMKLTPAEGLTSSHAVFTGVVVEMGKNTATRFGGVEVTLRVTKIWKGERTDEIVVHTAGSSAACGYPFEKGSTYLVYALSDEADPMRVSLCSRTAPVDRAQEDLDYLGKPKHVLDNGTGGKGRCSASRHPDHGGTLGFLLLVLGAVLGIRRLA